MNYEDMKKNLELLRLGLNSLPVSGEQSVNTIQACFQIVSNLIDECQAKIHQEKTGTSESAYEQSGEL